MPHRPVRLARVNVNGTDSLAELHRRLWHEVATSHDGVEAVATAGAFGPEVILIDIGMPRFDGLAATRSIRE